MNLFYLDRDLDRCAEFHIDRHVGKMQLEAAQLMSSALWVDKYLGFIPDRKLTADELRIINVEKAKEPDIDDRTFTRYLPTHINHPSAIWVRSNIEHYEWVFNYIVALNDECLYRGYKSHASCAEALKMPEPQNMPRTVWRDPDLAMPDELKLKDAVEAYRLFYMLDKAAIPATWRVREKPYWWREDIADYEFRFSQLNPHQKRLVVNKLKDMEIL